MIKEFEFKGQAYVRDRETDHKRKRDGKIIKLAIWASECAVCDELFEFTAPATTNRPKDPPRCCHEHRRPGVARGVVNRCAVCQELIKPQARCPLSDCPQVALRQNNAFD